MQIVKLITEFGKRVKCFFIKKQISRKCTRWFKYDRD